MNNTPSSGNIEARSWLSQNKNPSALATNRFQNTQEALDFVNKLYEAGAVEVLVDHVYDKDERVQNEGGPYADSLIIFLPQDKDKRKMLFEVFNEESRREFFEPHVDEGQNNVMLWWD